jgi:hypothetical protein
MEKQEQDVLIELIGSMQIQAAMFHGLIELLIARGFITEIEETELFNMAEMRLGRTPDSEAVRFARKILSEWRHEGLIQGRWPKLG